MRITSLILLCLCLTGCIRSKVMLVDPDKAVYDKNLTGFWSNVEDNTKSIAAFGPSNVETNPAGLICAQSLNFTDKGKLDDQDHPGPRFDYAFSVTIGKYGYLCVVDEDFSKPEKYSEWLQKKDFTCDIYRYKIERDKLTFWVGDMEKLKEAGLKTEQGQKQNSTLTFTGSREELVNFLKTKSDSVFPDDEKTVYKRVPL